MTFGSLMSGFSGAAMGFLYGGWIGAGVGFAIGFGVGLAVDALAPDGPSPGAPQLNDLRFPSASEGINIPDVLGTTKLTGNVFHYFGNRVVEIEEDMGGGCGLASGGEMVTGYEYYLSWAMGICLGPVDRLYSVYAGDDLVWSGVLDRPVSGGVETISLTISDYTYEDEEKTYIESIPYSKLVTEGYTGDYYQYTWANLDANPFAIFDDDPDKNFESALLALYIKYEGNSYKKGVTVNYIGHSWSRETKNFRIIVDNPIIYELGAQESYDYFWLSMTGTVEVGTIREQRSMGTMYFYFGTDDQPRNDFMVSDKSNTPPYRGLCYAFFDDNFIGTFNRMPAMKFIVGKFPQLSFHGNEIIDFYDYNPAHAIWYIMTNDLMAGMPEKYMDEITFADEADVLYLEHRGLSMLFDRQQTAMAYMETILNHVGGIVRYASDGNLADEYSSSSSSSSSLSSSSSSSLSSCSSSSSSSG